MEDIKDIYPFWSKLQKSEKELIKQAVRVEKYQKGMLTHRIENSCQGLLTVLKGQLRTYILSEEGREVTLFRVQSSEVCVLSASCLMEAITFDVFIEAMEETEVLVLPSVILNQIMKQNIYVELYLYKSATEKFSDVMWTMQQILFLKIDQRVAQFLWDEMLQKNTITLDITHDELAKYIGSAREVVTKVMKYFSQEHVVELKRGKVTIIDKDKLYTLL